jgi:4-hydroxythreonine-4-phosphate dehydrogenase
MAVRAAREKKIIARCRPLLVGDAWVLKRYAAGGVPVRPILALAEYRDGDALNILHVPHPGISSLELGRPQKVAGQSAALSLRAAVALALAGKVAVLVTGPISKESLRLAAVPYPGHTEMLAALSGGPSVEMVMAAGRMKALLLTRHIPFRDVHRRLTPARVVAGVTLTDAWLGRIGTRSRPRWLLCGLNPHAGDNGLLGNEEKRVLAPAVRTLRRRGVDIGPPLPADVAWARHAQGEGDIVACLTHDQGMIPLKALHPDEVVNVTAGLPFVRTSAGHGTAFDLAPDYRRADPSATLAAAHLALDLVKKSNCSGPVLAHFSPSPLAGEGGDGGCSHLRRDPPPQPSPSRGEGVKGS